MSLACSRSLFFMVFVAGALALGVSYYLEYAVGLQPCGMCLLQRICLALLTGICLGAAVHGPSHFASLMYWLLGLLCSLAGTVTAWRHVLLQSAPAHELSDCSASVFDLFVSAPWAYVVQQLFNGTVDCEPISWSLFDLSLPEWSLLFFVATTILSVQQLLRLAWIACRRPRSGESSHSATAGD
jgi:disulfide bond formation protein DsbB